MADETTVQEQRVITPGSSTDPGSVDSLPTTVLDSGEVAVVVNMGESAPDGNEQETPSDEDPMAAALAANQADAEEESPTEQQVIDATDDPQLTKEDQVALEKTQADNRAKLKAEEKTGGITSSKMREMNTSPKDWRVRLSLAPSARYLYNVATPSDILYPLKATNGVIFPYTPTIQTGYRASYEASELAHTNYKSYFYKNSSVDDITISGEFTAQDTHEAAYMLAVIHFFKTITKMFYGQDKEPRAGTPPPLVYLSGFGTYQFDNHPLAVSSFTYSLPNDVDYVRTTSTSYFAGSNPTPDFGLSSSRGIDYIKARLTGSSLSRGGGAAPNANFNYLPTSESTYVPSKIQISITGYPIVSRKNISKNFSVEKYATGALNKSSNNGGSGIW